jgi:hypothetical protein
LPKVSPSYPLFPRRGARVRVRGVRRNSRPRIYFIREPDFFEQMIFGVPDFLKKLVIIIMIIMLTTSMAIHMMMFENRMPFNPQQTLAYISYPLKNDKL